MENRLIKIGGSNFLLVPSHFIKVYNLGDYVYLCEVQDDGKTLIYRRMRKDELKNDEAEIKK